MDPVNKKQVVNSPEVALASEVFDQFCNATTLKSILGHYRQLCELLKVRPNNINQFYPKLKAKLRSWKAQALWKKFDQRANHKCYNRSKACPNTRVLIIGGGPCGLRTAIEAQLLGAKVVVIEKRDRMSRNNVLHLWPFVIQDLRGLGAKKFFGKFCAGSIDHISIRQLQCILLKVALILGVEFHESVSFDSLIEPPENQEDGKIGWRAKTLPVDHPVSQYEFDVLIGADGKRNTLEGFKRKEFRGKLAIAITANFINKRTEAEARVEEISGVAFIFNQKFFKELYQDTGIDLENIVYYKDDTHYFVMTAKKHSLIDKGVILQDHADTAKLLAKENVDREALMLYAREAAEFSTEYQMMNMEFAVNHYGQPDVAMFDFTSMYAAENASRVLKRHGHNLLMILVGDSLLEPFWPTGSGCARGFLSSLDAGWAIKGWGASFSPLEVIAERESIYRLLGQTTPENLNRDYAAYTLDPHTRYPNLNIRSVIPIQVRSLLDTDDPESIKQPVVQSEIDIPKKRRRRDLRVEAQIHPDTLLRWLQKQVALYDKIHIEDMGASFKDGLAICAIIHRYRPDLINFYSLNAEDVVKNNQLAFDTLEKELNISPIMTGEEMAQCDVPDTLTMFSYLTQIYEAFKGDIPYIKHPKLEVETEECSAHPKQLKQLTPEEKSMKRHSRSRYANENVQSHMDKKDNTTSRRSRKRRSTEKMSATMDERQKRLDEIEKHRTERMKRRQYLRKMATQQFYKSMQMLQANAKHEKDGPFEDYSIFLYRQTAPDFKDRVKDLEQKILYPDRQPKIHIGYERGNVDEEFSGRIKDFEDKLKGATSSEKKPKDLLRAIGKIEKTDWNVKEIEKKIEENKMGRGTRHDRLERVPKWSREQFLARQIKMEKRGNDQRDTYSKYADIDNTLKNIGKKIREGSALGHNKVSAMAEQFSNKSQDTEPKLQKSNTKATIVLPVQGSSEMCHFCNKRVYLMERLSAEGKFFHRGCFRCEYCSTSLRIGNHTFDREKNGGRFYCTQHFGLSGTMKTRAEKKRINLVNKENVPNTGITSKTPEKAKTPLEGIVGLDLLDRGQTPERIEFENLAEMSDPEEAHSQMDEDEWTDRNFGVSTAEMGSSDEISDMSDSDEEDEIFEEAIDQPLTTEGTLELAKNWTLRYSYPHATIGQSDTGSNEYEDSSDEYTSEDDESGTATEDEEDIRARELRKQEVWLKVPPRSSDTDTGSETEVKYSQGSVDPIIAQESLISFESKVTIPSVSNMNANDNESLFDRNNLEEFLESSNEVALTSGELALSANNQDTMTSANKNGTSFNVIQTSESVICETNSTLLPIPASTDSISNPNRSFCTNIPDNNRLDKENCSSEYESFVDENVQLDLNGSNNRVDSNSLQNGVININTKNFYSNSIDLSINVNNSNLNDLVKKSLDINNLKEDIAQSDETSSEQVAKITLADATPCTEVSKDLKVSDNETILNVDDLPGVVASSLNRNCLSSSLSETYRTIEIPNNNLVTSSHLDDLVEYSKSNLSEEVGMHKHENICAINQNKDSENKNIIDDSNNIHMSDVADEKINIHAVTPMIAASVLPKSIYPTVTITSPSPTQEIQLEELSLETSKLLVPQESHYIPDCDSAFDKLKRDLQQRKARNKIVGNGLRPLSTESARLKMSKYFTENKKIVLKCRSAQNEKAEETEDTSKIEVVKLDIKPRLSSKINTEKMLQYFDKTSSSNNCDKYKISNATGVAIKQNEHQNLEIDIENINDKTINTIDRQFDQIETQNGIAEDNGMISQSHLSVNEICNDKRETLYDNLDLIYDDLVKLQSHSNDIDIDYIDSMSSNIPKLENDNTDVSYSTIDLETILHTDTENDQNDITNNMKETEKIKSIEDILKNDINNIHTEKEVNVNLNNNMIDNSTIKKENIINIDSENSILNSEANEEKKENSILIYDDLVKLQPHSNDIDIDYIDSVSSNIPKLENDNTDVSSSTIDLETILHTDTENDQNDITNNMKETEKIKSIEDILKNDINNIHTEKEVNVNLNNNMIDNSTIKKEDIINIDSENSILNSETNGEKKENSIFSEKIALDNNNKEIKNQINILDKDTELYKNLLFENNNTKLIASLLLNNNTGEAIKHNIIHKSDTILNKSIPRFFCKDIKANSKSLPELRDIISENVSTAKIAIVDKVMDAAVHVIDTKVANDNSIQNCIREVPKRLEQECFSNEINFSQNNATTTSNLFTFFDEELSPPEIPVRKKSAKRNLKPLYQNQDVEDISKLQIVPEIPVRKKSSKRSLNFSSQNQNVEDLLKLQDQTVDDISKLHGQNDNDVSNIQSQDAEKPSEMKAKNAKKVAILQSQDINNTPKIHHQDVSNIKNHDIKSIQKLPKSNVEKIQNENTTNFSNLDNEISKDSMNITTAENRNADVKLQNQSISSAKNTHYSTNRCLPNKPEESIKSISYSNHSKKDKCTIS